MFIDDFYAVSASVDLDKGGGFCRLAENDEMELDDTFAPCLHMLTRKAALNLIKKALAKGLLRVQVWPFPIGNILDEHGLRQLKLKQLMEDKGLTQEDIDFLNKVA